MKQLMVSTRGSFNLWTGKKLKDKPIFITPKRKFEQLKNADEVVIFIHGMRNSTVGAKMGTNALRLRLRRLGYKHPVIGFSYDSNIRGAHIDNRYFTTLWTAYHIADSNGEKLKELIQKIYNVHPSIVIRIVAHSLGCEVVKAMLEGSDNTFIRSLHLFGSPLEVTDVFTMRNPEKVINYYNPKDTVIQEGVTKGDLIRPSCLHPVRNLDGIKSKRIYAKDHRFKSQMKALRSFP